MQIIFTQSNCIRLTTVTIPIISKDSGTQYRMTGNTGWVAHIKTLAAFNSAIWRWSVRLLPKVCAKNTLRLVHQITRRVWSAFNFISLYPRGHQNKSLSHFTFNFYARHKAFFYARGRNEHQSCTYFSLVEPNHCSRSPNVPSWCAAAFDRAPLGPCAGVYTPLKYPGRHIWLEGRHQL